MVRQRETMRPVSEDTVSAGSIRGSGSHNRIPESGIYIPNYSGVNQVLYDAGGAGAVSFMNSLASSSSKAMAVQQEAFDNLEANTYTTELNGEMSRMSEEWQKNPENISGRGYQEYMTNEYQRLSGGFLEKATNGNVKQKLESVFSVGVKDIANKTFQRENEQSTAYLFQETGKQMQGDLIQLMNNPEMTQSLSQQYINKVNTMKGVMPAAEYQKFASESMEHFVYSNGIGWIKKNPYQAKDLINGDYYTKGLSADRYMQLNHAVISEIEHREAKERKRQKLMEKIDSMRADANYSDYEIKIHSGSASKLDIESMYENGELGKVEEQARIRKNDLLRKLIAFDKSDDKETEDFKELSDHIAWKTPAPEISMSKKNKFMNDHFRSVDEQRKAEGKGPVSYTEKIQWLKNNAIVFDSDNSSLKNVLITNIKNTDNAKQIMDACIAINGNEDVPAIRGIDKECVDFSYLAVNLFSGNKNAEEVKNLRDQYFKIDKATVDYNTQKWKVEKYDASQIESFLNKHNFNIGETDWVLFKTHNIPAINRDYLTANASSIIERVYKRTGSMSQAEAVASEWLHTKVKKTEINGEPQWMINPPKGEVVGGISDYAVQNFVSLKGQELVTAIQDNGDNYKGGVKIRLKDKFISPVNSIDDLYKKSYVKSDKKVVEAYIDGDWSDRNLYIDSLGDAKGVYRYYILPDEEDPNYREYLIDPRTGAQATINLSPAGQSRLRGN